MDSQNNKVDIGQKIKQIRKIRGITLQQLSEETGMSYSYLSGLERNKHSISINNLQKLAEYFKIDMVYFLDINERKGYLIRKKDRSTLIDDGGLLYQMISPDTSENLQVSFVTLPPHPAQERHIHKHQHGEEFITVLEGEVTILVEAEIYKLKEGDSTIFPSEKEHCIYTEEKEAKIIIVSSPPNGRTKRDMF